MNAMSSSEAAVMWQLLGEELMGSEQGGHLPPGFRFHPTDEELITYYLASKVFSGSFCPVDIVEVDLNRCEPWELPDVAKMGEREWYFFSLRDRKYPTGVRTNRATGAGYWKATGKDREVHAAATGALLGMKKTLVFYKGRAPRGEKTKWVLHEYRLEGDYSCRHSYKEEWVICRIFNKSSARVSSSSAADEIIKNQYLYSDQPYCSYFDPSPSSPTTSRQEPLLLPELQTLETLSPIQSLLQSNNPFLNSTLNPNPNPNLYPLPIILQQHQQQDQEEGLPFSFSNWLDVYIQQNPGIYELAFGGQLLGPTTNPPTMAELGALDQSMMK